MSEYECWERNPALLEGEDYLGNNRLAEEIAKHGYAEIIANYTYIDFPQVETTIKLIAGAWEAFRGVGVDLGGGVGCISSTIARKPEVKQIYCVEMTDQAVIICQPIVKEKILGSRKDVVHSVIGDFDQLKLESRSMDFAVALDSIHHSLDPVVTLRECRRVLKEDGRLVIIDRAHNNSTPDSEIERMLNIQYNREYLLANFRSPDTILSRRDNGEHEYRFFEWQRFFELSGFELLRVIAIKTDNSENRAFRNDFGAQEFFVNHNLGGFGQRKNAFILRPTVTT